MQPSNILRQTDGFADLICLRRSDSLALAHHPLLGNAGYQFAGTVEYAAAIEPAPASRPWGIGRIGQPLIGPRLAVEPQRMVEAGADQFAAHP